VAGPVYQPNIFSVKVNDSETLADVGGMSILPDPETAPLGHWRPVDLKLTPKINGIATTEDMPVLYLVGLKPPRAEGVAFASRYGSGVVQWSGNPDVINHVRSALVKIGNLRADRTGMA
jgi:hypothetical protein